MCTMDGMCHVLFIKILYMFPIYSMDVGYTTMCAMDEIFHVQYHQITILYVFNPHYGCHEHIVCQDITYLYMYSSLTSYLTITVEDDGHEILNEY